MSAPLGESGDRSYWLDDEANVSRVYRWLWIVCLALLALDLLNVLGIGYEKHAEFAVEGLFGFSAIYGLVGYAALVLVGKALRGLVQRDEDYYER